jgi:hypothetical protein
MTHDIPKLEKKIRELHQSISNFNDDASKAEFFKIIHGPGWTTLPEYELVLAAVDGLQGQISAAHGGYQTLVGIAGQIGRD